jgi:hypothetical protein
LKTVTASVLISLNLWIANAGFGAQSIIQRNMTERMMAEGGIGLQVDAAAEGSRCSQPSSIACQAATLAGPAPAAPDVIVPCPSAPVECEAVDLEEILKEKGECGVRPKHGRACCCSRDICVSVTID